MSLPNKALGELRKDADLLAQQLPRSSNREEAFEKAIKAAETSMQALKLARGSDQEKDLSIRVKQLLDEAERIKQSEDWMKVVEPMSSSSSGEGSNGIKSRTLKEPQSTRKLEKREQILLLKASFLNGFKFPPWTTPPEPNEFELRQGEELFLYVSYTHSLLLSFN